MKEPKPHLRRAAEVAMSEVRQVQDAKAPGEVGAGAAGAGQAGGTVLLCCYPVIWRKRNWRNQYRSGLWWPSTGRRGREKARSRRAWRRGWASPTSIPGQCTGQWHCGRGGTPARAGLHRLRAEPRVRADGARPDRDGGSARVPAAAERGGRGRGARVAVFAVDHRGAGA